MRLGIRTLAASTLVSLLLISALGCARKYDLVNAPTVPAAKGEVELGVDRNDNTTIELEVTHLARPSELTTPASVYVVWVKPMGEPPKNQGELVVNNDLEGWFKTVTPFRNFELFVTAENSARTDLPSGPRLLHQIVSR